MFLHDLFISDAFFFAYQYQLNSYLFNTLHGIVLFFLQVTAVSIFFCVDANVKNEMSKLTGVQAVGRCRVDFLLLIIYLNLSDDSGFKITH